MADQRARRCGFIQPQGKRSRGGSVPRPAYHAAKIPQGADKPKRNARSAVPRRINRGKVKDGDGRSWGTERRGQSVILAHREMVKLRRNSMRPLRAAAESYRVRESLVELKHRESQTDPFCSSPRGTRSDPCEPRLQSYSAAQIDGDWKKSPESQTAPL